MEGRNVTETTVQSADLQRRQYRTLLGLSKAIATHRNLSDLLHDLARHLRDVVDFRYLSVSLHDGSRHVMRLHILETSEPAVRPCPSEIPIEGSIAGWVWQHQQPYVTPDGHQETGFPTTTLVRHVPVKSVCVLPLTTAHRRLGVLNLASEKTGAYNQLDLECAQLVAAEVAVAVEHALSFREAASYRRQLAHERDRSRLLLEVNNMLVSTLHLRELLAAISACLTRVMPHDGASLALYDRARNMLRASALDLPGHEDVMTEGERFPREGNPAGLALTTRRVVLCDGRKVEDLPAALKRLRAAGVKSGCSIPLISRDRGLGVLCMMRLSDDAFTDDDVAVLSQIANQVAIAVENARAFREIDALKNTGRSETVPRRSDSDGPQFRGDQWQEPRAQTRATAGGEGRTDRLDGVACGRDGDRPRTPGPRHP
jgi:formate hydrogenlyase transcriptional activator